MAYDVHQSIEAIWLVLGLVWAGGALRLKPGVATPRSPTRPLELAALLCAGILLFFGRPRAMLLDSYFLPGTAITHWMGILLAIAGAAVAIFARLYLGGNWSWFAKIRQGQELVQRGPYALVRHPIYTGILIAAAGTAVAFGQVRDLIALPVLALAFWLKSRSEERLLEQTFGDDYNVYRRRVSSAIVPFVL